MIEAIKYLLGKERTIVIVIVLITLPALGVSLFENNLPWFVSVVGILSFALSSLYYKLRYNEVIEKLAGFRISRWEGKSIEVTYEVEGLEEEMGGVPVVRVPDELS